MDRMYRGSGSAQYDPIVLLKMVLFQYLKGNLSPATWFEEAKWNEAMQWLGRGYVPAGVLGMTFETGLASSSNGFMN